MKVWRIQHPEDELGPWWSDGWNSFSEFDDGGTASYEDFKNEWVNSGNSSKHRGPYQDQVAFAEGVDVFAVRSKKMLKNWFGKGHLPAMLKSAGFTIAVYEIDPDLVKLGKRGKQVAFDPADAKFVGEESLDILG